MKTLTRYCTALAVLGCLTLLGSNVAEASHGRGGYITYQATGTPGEVEITAIWYARRSYYGGNLVVGSTIYDARLYLGDGSNAGDDWTVTAFSEAEDWIVTQKVVVHQYADPNKTYEVNFGSCCRVDSYSSGISPDGMGNRASESYDMLALVRPGNTSPNTSSAPFVGIPRSTNATYQVPVVVRDGDDFRCRFATDSEAGGGAGPPNMSINANTCLITWDNQSLSAGFYTEQVIIEELDGQGNVKGSVPLDMLFQIGGQASTNTPPVCTIAPGTPAGGGTTDVDAVVNMPLSFTVTGTDTDTGQTLTISNTSLPAGATQSPDPASGPSSGPVVATVDWTPTATGTFLASFAVSDGTFSTLCTARINVGTAQTDPCKDPATAPSYAGGYVTNAAGTRAFIKIDVPQGGAFFEFYAMTNLVVGDPEIDTESGTTLTGFTRSGDSFLFMTPGSPATLYFPITTADPSVTRVAFFLKVTDTCGRTVDVDPSFPLSSTSEHLEGLALRGAMPNPAVGAATIRFSMEQAGPARVTVYDVLGREMAVVANADFGAGDQSVSLDASSLSSGLYVIRLEAGGRVLTQTFTVAR